MFHRDEGLRRSLPAAEIVRGYRVRRMPIGALLDASERLAELLDNASEQAGAEDAAQVLRRLGLGGARGDLRRLARLGRVYPRAAVKAAAILCECEEERLLSDAELGADGVCEIIAKWLELNRIENFTRTAAGLSRRMRAMKEHFSG